MNDLHPPYNLGGFIFNNPRDFSTLLACTLVFLATVACHFAPYRVLFSFVSSMSQYMQTISKPESRDWLVRALNRGQTQPTVLREVEVPERDELFWEHHTYHG